MSREGVPTRTGFQMPLLKHYIAYTKIYNELNTNEQLNNEDNDINTDEIQDKTKNNNNNINYLIQKNIKILKMIN